MSLFYKWSEVLGHERPKEMLQRAITMGHLHHALLFAGAAGTGKRLSALALASALNCLDRSPEQADACGQCRGCLKLAHESHPDVVVVEPEGNVIKALKIQQVRDLQRMCMTAPYEGRARVVVLNDAHTMTEEASNALLKTLEEPHANTHIVLITDQLHLMLETIRSRCQLVRFGVLEEAQIVSWLQAHPRGDDEIPWSAEDLRVAALFGEGSLGRAQELLQTGMLAQRRAFLEQLTMLDRRHSLPLMQLAEEISSDRAGLEQRLDLLNLFLRDTLLHTAGASPTRLLNRDLRAMIEDTAARLGAERILALLETVHDAQERLQRNVNPQMVTEHLLRTLAAPGVR